ncbi:MAG: S41 family peptidase [Planctomycetota bacterium]
MTDRWYRLLFSAVLAVLATLLFGCGSTPADLQPIDDERRTLHVESFDYIWQTVKDRHWDPEVYGESWDSARDDLRPEVEAAATDREARRSMRKLLERTGQSHFGLFPAEIYGRLEADGGEASVGIEARLRDDAVLVVRVREGSPAYQAGVRPGWEIVRVGERGIDGIIEAAGDVEEASDAPNRVDTTVGRTVESLLSGASDGMVEVTFIDQRGDEVVLDLGREIPPGNVVSFGNLPEMYISHETRTLAEGIGYFRFSAFFDPVVIMPAYQRAVVNHREAPGFVIDLRGNPGGIITMAPGMAGWFIDEKQIRLGTMLMRDQEFKLVINPRRPKFGGRVAVLIDELSASNAEILSGGLKDIGAARVFGRTTAGQVLPAAAEKLPNGDRFIYAFADYDSASGQRLEGEGVAPNEPIDETREALLGGQDPVLDAAVAWILQGQ